jgi:hypothetical protein
MKRAAKKVSLPDISDCMNTPSFEWFYTQQGGTFGPVSSTDLRAAAHLGFLGPDDMVRRSDRTDWVAASTVHGLFKKKN